jgi:hypothetical protein
MSFEGNIEGSPVDKLVHDWGYEPLMPENIVHWEPLTSTTHIAVGIYLFTVGKPLSLRLFSQKFLKNLRY